MATLSLVAQPTARPTMASGSTILKRGFIEVLLQHEAPTVGNDSLWFQADSRTGVRTRAGLPILDAPQWPVQVCEREGSLASVRVEFESSQLPAWKGGLVTTDGVAPVPRTPTEASVLTQRY